MLESLFVKGFVDVYHKLHGFRAKRQHLSMFAPYFPYHVTAGVFGIKRKLVYFARVHAGEYGGARSVPPSISSYRISPEAAHSLNAFVSRPEITQVLASAPGGKMPISELTLRPEAAWRRYDAMTPAGACKVCRTTFLRYLDQPCFRLQRSVTPHSAHTAPTLAPTPAPTDHLSTPVPLRSKSCLCGPCESHGWQNFEDLDTLIKELALGTSTERGFLARARALRDYLKHDYRRECVNASSLSPSTPRSAWLCIPYALSTLTDGAYSCLCDHDHTMGPSRCDEIVHLIEDLSQLLETKRHKATARAARSAAAAITAGCGGGGAAEADANVVAELNERAEELLACGRHLDLYVRHLVRKALSHTITPTLLERLKERPTAMHIIVDYKQKVLPTGHRETQTAAFGKKGKSLHGATALRWDAKRGDYQVLNVRVVCDDSNQTWFHTLAALRTTLVQILDVWVDITESTLQSDGAGNYNCTAFMDTVKDVFRGRSIRLTRHVVTEVPPATAPLTTVAALPDVPPATAPLTSRRSP